MYVHNAWVMTISIDLLIPLQYSVMKRNKNIHRLQLHQDSPFVMSVLRTLHTYRSPVTCRLWVGVMSTLRLYMTFEVYH